MSAIATDLYSYVSRRGTVVAVIGAVHVALVYVVTSWAPVKAVFDTTPIEVALVDLPAPAADTPPPPEPQIVSVTTPTIEPPLITLTEEPPPNAITVAVAETASAAEARSGCAARHHRCRVCRSTAAALSARVEALG